MTTTWPLDIDLNVGDTDYPTKVGLLETAINDLRTVVTTERNLVATSTSSNSVGTGSKSFTLAESNRNFGIGQALRAASSASPTNYIDGYVSGYNTSTNVLTIVGTAVGGSGTLADWTITVAAAAGPVTGLTPGTVADGQVVGNVGGALAGVSVTGGLAYSEKTTSFTAVTGNAYGINGNSIVATLPLAPTAGDVVALLDANGTFTGASIARNGELILGQSISPTFTPGDCPIVLRYTGATYGWTFA